MNNTVEQCAWRFPYSNGGVEQGYNEPGLENFRNNRYNNLAREICQNSLDAAKTYPVQVVFSRHEIHLDEFPGFADIARSISACAAYWQGSENRKENKRNLAAMARMKRRVQELQRENSVSVLKISDYHTHGARGSRLKSGGEWTGLVREIGSNIKESGSGGSVGVGKYAPFLVSELRTLFYGTMDEDGNTAFQGHAILTTFSDDAGKGRQGNGFWGYYDEAAEWSQPLTDMDSLRQYSSLYQRDTVGTDIFAMDFSYDPTWKEQLICGIINNFFFSIWKGLLEVTVEDVVIRKDTLKRLIQEYNALDDEGNPQITIGTFFSILDNVSADTVFYVTNQTSAHVPRILRHMGQFELYITFSNTETENKGLLEMRRQGMCIEKVTDFCRGTLAKPQCIFRAVGHDDGTIHTPLDDINMLLQECEDGRHNCWRDENCKDKDLRQTAAKVLKAIKAWIRDEVKAHTAPITAESIPAFGMKLTTDEGGREPRQIEAFSNTAFSVFKDGKRKRVKHPDISSTHTEDLPDEVEDIIDSDGRIIDEGGDAFGDKEHHGYGGVGGDGTSGPKGNEGQPVYPPGEEPGFSEAYGKTAQAHSLGKNGLIGLNNIRAIFNETQGLYRVIFTPQVSWDNAYVQIKLKNYDNRLEPVDIQAVRHHEELVPHMGNEIGPLHLTAGKRIALHITLAQKGRFTLGVSAYGKK